MTEYDSLGLLMEKVSRSDVHRQACDSVEGDICKLKERYGSEWVAILVASTREVRRNREPQTRKSRKALDHRGRKSGLGGGSKVEGEKRTRTTARG